LCQCALASVEQLSVHPRSAHGGAGIPQQLVVEVLCLTTISIFWMAKLSIWQCFTFCLKKYHPSRVLTLVYQPFALGTMALLTYNEAKINTRKRNIAGYMLFTASTLMLIVVSTIHVIFSFYSLICLIQSNSSFGSGNIRGRWI